MSENIADLRYSCQVALPGFGLAGQARLARSRVLIAGIGGLGCPAAQYLVASGVGTVGLADYDIVSLSNLHRQFLFGPGDEGKLKVEVAAERLSQQNPAVMINRHSQKIGYDNVQSLLAGYDLVLDCTDNFESRYLLNDAAVLAGKPLVYGAIYQYEGQVSLWNIANEDGSRSPNYRDLFPEVDASQIPNCSVGGVIPTLAGIIGCMQANEAIKYLSGHPDLLAGSLMLFDALSMRSRVIKMGKVSRVRIDSLERPSEVFRISAETLAAHEGFSKYTLVDVREDSERDNGHIGGIHIPLKELRLRLHEISSDKDIIFYCASGKRSDEAVKLARGSFPGRELFSLEGGLNAVRNADALRLP